MFTNLWSTGSVAVHRKVTHSSLVGNISLVWNIYRNVVVVSSVTIVVYMYCHIVVYMYCHLYQQMTLLRGGGEMSNIFIAFSGGGGGWGGGCLYAYICIDL